MLCLKLQNLKPSPENKRKYFKCGRTNQNARDCRIAWDQDKFRASQNNGQQSKTPTNSVKIYKLYCKKEGYELEGYRKRQYVNKNK